MERSDGNDVTVRRDVLLSIKECDPHDHGDAMIHCIKLLRGIPYILNKFHYTACGPDYVVPRQCQLALYKRIILKEEEEDEGEDGTAPISNTDNNVSSSTAPTAKAAEGYVRHLDRCTLSISEMGLLGWLRASDYRHRVITAILYLNSPTWNSGGELRLFDYNNATAASTSIDNVSGSDADFNYSDILPTGGKLILFDSSKVEHQVLASHVGGEDRYALTCWFNGNLTPEKK
jgi:hypothetical protein